MFCNNLSQQKMSGLALSWRHQSIPDPVIGSKGETSGLNKLRDHSDYVLIWKKSQAACMQGQDAIQSHMSPSD